MGGKTVQENFLELKDMSHQMGRAQSTHHNKGNVMISNFYSNTVNEKMVL